MSRGDTFHLRWRGKVAGPFTWAEIERKLDAHEIGLLHDLQHNNNWTSLGEFLEKRGEVVRLTSPVPVAAPPSGADLLADAQGPPPLPRAARPVPNRWIFITLGLIAGFLGLHDFYAQHWIRGALLLAISILLFTLNWGLIWPWLWAIGEIITTKFDGQGRRMPWKRNRPQP